MSASALPATADVVDGDAILQLLTTDDEDDDTRSAFRWAAGTVISRVAAALLTHGMLDNQTDTAAHICFDSGTAASALKDAIVGTAVIRQLHTQAVESGRGLRYVAAARSVPADLARQLAEHDDERVRQDLAGNRHIPDDVLETLASDSRKEVRMAAVTNPATPTPVVADCLTDRAAAVPVRARSTLLHRCRTHNDVQAAHALAGEQVTDLLAATDEDGYHNRSCPQLVDLLCAVQLLGGNISRIEQATALHRNDDLTLQQLTDQTK